MSRGAATDFVGEFSRLMDQNQKEAYSLFNEMNPYLLHLMKKKDGVFALIGVYNQSSRRM